MKVTVTKVIDTITKEDFHGAFEKLLERYNKWIAAGGDYFEGDKSLMCVLSIKVPIRKSLETYLMILVNRGLVFGSRLFDPFLLQYPRELCISHFLEQIMVCARIICRYNQVLVSCTIHSEPPFPPSHVCSYAPSVPVCDIRLLLGLLYGISRHKFWFVHTSLISMVKF